MRHKPCHTRCVSEGPLSARKLNTDHHDYLFLQNKKKITSADEDRFVNGSLPIYVIHFLVGY